MNKKSYKIVTGRFFSQRKIEIDQLTFISGYLLASSVNNVILVLPLEPMQTKSSAEQNEEILRNLASFLNDSLYDLCFSYLQKQTFYFELEYDIVTVLLCR